MPKPVKVLAVVAAVGLAAYALGRRGWPDLRPAPARCAEQVVAIWKGFNLLMTTNGSYVTPFLAQRVPGDAWVGESSSETARYDFVKNEGWPRSTFTCPDGGLLKVGTSCAVCSRHGFLDLGDDRLRRAWLPEPMREGAFALPDGTCYVGDDYFVLVRGARASVSSPHVEWLLEKGQPGGEPVRIVRTGGRVRLIMGKDDGSPPDLPSVLDVTDHPAREVMLERLAPLLE